MVDLVLTASDVIAGSNAVVENGRAGAAITAGQVVYKEAASGTFKPTDTNSLTAEVKKAYGIALNDAANGQPLAVAKGGDVTLGSVLVAGSAYYASETPGGIQPAADVASEDVVFLGHAKSTTVLSLAINNTGVTL